MTHRHAPRPAPTPDDDARGPGRFRRFWVRHRKLFWSLHSVWALTTGVIVVVLSRERYGFVPWVVLFLAITWASTLYFGRRLERAEADEQDTLPPAPREEFASYVMRALYQETLFFLLPFYAYSTVIASPNVVFTALLLSLALFSCLDLVFDRLLRTRPLFGLLFFATVAFAAVNLLLPIIVPIDPTVATAIAAFAAVLSAVPLSLRAGTSWAAKLKLATAAVVFLITALTLPMLVPPVPLRLERAVFASNFDRANLTPVDTLNTSATAAELEGSLFVLLQIFAPSTIPASVSMEWTLDGEPFRVSREVEITAHEMGFRVWDGWRPESGAVAPGLYRVTVRTSQARVFGQASITVRSGARGP